MKPFVHTIEKEGNREMAFICVAVVYVVFGKQSGGCVKVNVGGWFGHPSLWSILAQGFVWFFG